MTRTAIRNTANKIWIYLGDNGNKVSLAALPHKLKIKPYLAHQAVGWLACGDKIKFTRHNGKTYVSLPRRELNTYRRNQIVPSCCG